MPTPDDLHARAPVDRVAARVLRGNGVHFDPQKKVLTADSDLPLAVRAARCNETRNPTYMDLTGVSFGRFRVIGLSREVREKWVVRCTCGRYSMRSAKAVKNPRNSSDCCEHCRHLQFLQREDQRR